MPAEVWQDPQFLLQLDREMHVTSRDGGNEWESLGFKPRDPEDPRWLKVATALCFLLTIAAFVYVVFYY